jgi:DNA-binding response OmpR family regulator
MSVAAPQAVGFDAISAAVYAYLALYSEVEQIAGPLEMTAAELVGAWITGESEVQSSRSAIEPGQVPSSGIYRWWPIEIDVRRHRVSVDGQEVSNIPNMEYRLLLALVAAAGCVVTRAQLLLGVWEIDFGEDVADRTVDVHVSRLRSRLKKRDPRYHALIGTMPQAGYQMVRLRPT